MSDQPRCEWEGCGDVAVIGATKAPERYAIWLCRVHVDDWLEWIDNS